MIGTFGMLVITDLPHLQPILSISFALNLAYLGLERFRYKAQINAFANERLANELPRIPEGLGSNGWYLTLQRLANREVQASTNGKGNVPNELWGIIYKHFFEKELDMWVAGFATVFLAALITMGAAHEFDYLKVSMPYFGRSLIHWWFWTTVVLGIWPVASVGLGRNMVKGAHAYISEHVRNMVQVLQREVPQAGVSTGEKVADKPIL